MESSSLPESFVFIMPVNLTHSLTRACFCFLPPRTQCKLHTRIHEYVRQLCKSSSPTSELKKSELQICISVNCGTISAPHALPILKKKNTQKYFVSMKSWNSLFLCLFSKTISLIFRKSIYALSMPTCSTPAQSCIKFQKKLSVKFVFSAKSTHTLWLFLNKQINHSVEETISCNSRPKASD